MKVRITKLKEPPYPEVANNITEGYSKEGNMEEEPVVGEPVIVATISSYFRTSLVEQVNKNSYGWTIMTLNSIYKIEKLD